MANGMTAAATMTISAQTGVRSSSVIKKVTKHRGCGCRVETAKHGGTGSTGGARSTEREALEDKKKKCRPKVDKIEKNRKKKRKKKETKGNKIGNVPRPWTAG